MRTALIANALRKCAHYVTDCDNCPYKFNEGNQIDESCFIRLYNDAAALIETQVELIEILQKRD